MKTVKDFKDYDFENCDVPEEYWGDYTHANYFKKAFIPIARKEFKALAKKLGAELIFSISNGLHSSKKTESSSTFTSVMFVGTIGMTRFFTALQKVKKIIPAVQTVTVLTKNLKKNFRICLKGWPHNENKLSR